MTELEQNASVQRAAASMGMTAAQIVDIADSLRRMAGTLQRHQDGIEAAYAAYRAALATHEPAQGREAQRSPYDIRGTR